MTYLIVTKMKNPQRTASTPAVFNFYTVQIYHESNPPERKVINTPGLSHLNS